MMRNTQYHDKISTSKNSLAYLILAFFCTLTLLITASSDANEAAQESADEAHQQLFSENQYPSANECANCHKQHFEEWAVSQHAYAQMSPVFNAMHGTIGKLTAGTNGDFCIRCHTPVGMNLGEKEFMSNIDRHPTSREGVTCIACHRLNQSYGKISGRLHIEGGDLTKTFYGPTGNNEGIQHVMEKGAAHADPSRGGKQIHAKVEPFFQLTTPAFCGTCHDVNLVNGFRLEEAFSEYKNSPAAQNGVTCQDCHMGKEPGKILTDKSDPDFEIINYDFGPIANNVRVKLQDRKRTNHMFVGPDYSLLHPGIFPHNDTAAEMATINEWLQFNWKEKWGSEEFESEVDEDEYEFPERWADSFDREEAWELLVTNLELLKNMEQQRLKLMRNGYLLGDIKVDENDSDGIEFAVQVKNGTDGHNVPTGFDAERLVWLYVEVRDANDKLIKVSGDLDPNGDLRDLHSTYVHNHELPLDDELFNLQSKFLVRNLRGGEREQVLPVNYSASPLVFLRPSTNATVLNGRPNGARKHKKTIEPLGERWANYTVTEEQLAQGKGPFKVKVQLKAAMIPVNLVNEIKDVGFDYGLSARDISETLAFGHVNENRETIIWNEDDDDPAINKVVGHQIIWEKTLQL